VYIFKTSIATRKFLTNKMDFKQQIKGDIDLTNTIDTSNKIEKHVNITTREIEFKNESRSNYCYINKDFENKEKNKKIKDNFTAIFS
jgi:hypothetical protein